jgi:hypothetical protein
VLRERQDLAAPESNAPGERRYAFCSKTPYFSQDGLLRRHDYEVDISGGTPAAHYVSEQGSLWNYGADETHSTWTSARGSSVPSPLVISIDISQLEFRQGA